MTLKLKALSSCLLLGLAFQMTNTAFANTATISDSPKNTTGKILLETAKFPGRVVTAGTGSAIGLTGGTALGLLAAPIIVPLSLIDCSGGHCSSLNKRQAALRIVTLSIVTPPAVGFIGAKECAKIGWHVWDSVE